MFSSGQRTFAAVSDDRNEWASTKIDVGVLAARSSRLVEREQQLNAII
jgi:hypothetical protein